MNEIPECVKKLLDNTVHSRNDKLHVRKIILQLSIRSDTLFSIFYTNYKGSFGSSRFSHELLDLCDNEENILGSSKIFREQYEFSDRYFVISNMSGLSVFVYDALDEAVYDVDFEGGDELLKKGELEKRWESFEAFLCEYFC